MEYILLFRNILADALVMFFWALKFFYESDGVNGVTGEYSVGTKVCGVLMLIFMILHAISIIYRLVKYNSLCWFQP
jgi:hypothetical protein